MACCALSSLVQGMLTSTGSSSAFCIGAAEAGTRCWPLAVETITSSPSCPVTCPFTQVVVSSCTQHLVPIASGVAALEFEGAILAQTLYLSLILYAHEEYNSDLRCEDLRTSGRGKKLLSAPLMQQSQHTLKRLAMSLWCTVDSS